MGLDLEAPFQVAWVRVMASPWQWFGGLATLSFQPHPAVRSVKAPLLSRGAVPTGAIELEASVQIESKSEITA